MSSVDSEELKRLLAQRNNGPTDPFARMEYKPPPATSRTRREIQTPDGQTIYVEVTEDSVNPYSLQQVHNIIQVSGRCHSCNAPVFGDALALGLIRPCLLCRKGTCQTCRANTNLPEVKPEYRGQAVCPSCWDKHAGHIIVTCPNPNCRQPVKDYYDVKRCVDCGDAACPACGVPLPGGALLCGACFSDREKQKAAAEAADKLFQDVFGWNR